MGSTHWISSHEQGPLAPPASAASYDAPPVATMAAAAAVASGGAPKSYSMSWWDPHTGSHPMSEGAIAPPASVAYDAPPAAFDAPPAATISAAIASGGPPKSFSMSQWDPCTGSHPMSEGTSSVGSFSPQAANAAAVPPPPPVQPAAPAGPSMADLAKDWASMNQDQGSPSSSQSFLTLPLPRLSAVEVDPRSSQSGSSTGGKDAFSPQAANAAAVPPPPPVQPAAPAGPSMADLAKDWASMNQDQGSPSSSQSFLTLPLPRLSAVEVDPRSSQSGSSTGGKDAPGGWTPSASSPRAAAPQKDTVADLAIQWAAMNN